MVSFQFVLILLLYALLGCSPKAVDSQERQVPKSTYSEVHVEADPFTVPGSEKIETHYSLTEADCLVAWQTISSKRDGKREVHLFHRSDCGLPFQESAILHKKVLARILKDYSVSEVVGIRTGGLRSLHPDGSWNAVVAFAALRSENYQNYRRKFPKHTSGKSLNQIFVDLIHQTRPHAPFKNMLAELGLNFEVKYVEKVFNSNIKNAEKSIDDAGSIWWKPL